MCNPMSGCVHCLRKNSTHSASNCITLTVVNFGCLLFMFSVVSGCVEASPKEHSKVAEVHSQTASSVQTEGFMQ